jgi:hypothetical protein
VSLPHSYALLEKELQVVDTSLGLEPRSRQKELEPVPN